MPKSAQHINREDGQELHWYRAWSLALLSMGVIILSLAVFVVLSTPVPTSKTLSNVMLEYKADKQSVRVGQTIVLGVYFKGEDATNVLVSDIRPSYDKTKLTLTDVKAGPYFAQPIAKFDKVKGYYVLAANPGVPQVKNKDASVIRFEFKTLSPGTVEISFDPGSLAYVEGKKGGGVVGSALSFEVTK